MDLRADDLDALKKHEGEFVTVTGEVVGTHIAKSGKVSSEFRRRVEDMFYLRYLHRRSKEL